MGYSYKGTCGTFCFKYIYLRKNLNPQNQKLSVQFKMLKVSSIVLKHQKGGGYIVLNNPKSYKNRYSHLEQQNPKLQITSVRELGDKVSLRSSQMCGNSHLTAGRSALCQKLVEESDGTWEEKSFLKGLSENKPWTTKFTRGASTLNTSNNIVYQ